jgi:hypothetical protein
MKRLLIVTAVAVVIFAVIILAMWIAGRDVYVVDQPITASPTDCGAGTRIAVIGDYGLAGQPEADVAALIDLWGVDAIVTAGDNNYMDGAGGKDLYPFKPRPLKGSAVRYNQDYGAQLINTTAQCLNLSFFSRADKLIDSVTLHQ